MSHPESLTRLIDELKKLPGIGGKSAQRLAFHVLRGSRAESAQSAHGSTSVMFEQIEQ